jgi:hypothetical protein
MKLRRFLSAALAIIILAEIADLAWLSAVRATITTTATQVTAAGNGSTTQFNFSFVGVSANDLVVSTTVTATGVTTPLTLNVNYTVTLNAAPANSVWGVGGYITYPISGTPLALGNTLTIQRKVPYTQLTPFQNQGQFLPNAIETAVDLLTMEVQQLNTLFAGALVQPATDTSTLSPLPNAAARANNALCFDSTGYVPTACTTPASGTISSAMQPVVGAASLSAGRTAFGLGGAAVENIGGSCGGLSIQDDGSAGGANGVGYLRVAQTTFQDSTNKAVSCNYNLTTHISTGPITFTLALASSTYFNGFSFTIIGLSGITTLTPNGSDQIAGLATGASLAIPAGTNCSITTNAAAAPATWWVNCNASVPNLAASAAASALTLTLNAPSITFRNTTLATGTAIAGIPVAGITITIPSTATLGTSNSTPFRIWIFAAYNSGTPILGVATCSAAGIIYACTALETLRNTSGTGLVGAAISTSSTVLGTLYPASTLTNDVVRIIGYADYASGLGTAGTWASAPTTLQLCIEPFVCRRPGDIVQVVTASNQTQQAVTSITYAAFSDSAAIITPTSTPNLIRILMQGTMTNGATAAFLQMSRGATQIGNPITVAASSVTPLSILVWDAPGTTTSTTYAPYGKMSSNTLDYPTTNSGTITELWEVMGALDPANDNADLRMAG